MIDLIYIIFYLILSRGKFRRFSIYWECSNIIIEKRFNLEFLANRKKIVSKNYKNMFYNLTRITYENYAFLKQHHQVIKTRFKMFTHISCLVWIFPCNIFSEWRASGRHLFFILYRLVCFIRMSFSFIIIFFLSIATILKAQDCGTPGQTVNIFDIFKFFKCFH